MIPRELICLILRFSDIDNETKRLQLYQQIHY